MVDFDILKDLFYYNCGEAYAVKPRECIKHSNSWFKVLNDNGILP